LRTCYCTVSDEHIHQKSTMTRHKSGKALAYLEVLERPDDGPELLHDRANIQIQDFHMHKHWDEEVTSEDSWRKISCHI
jgi:hypothetical protein